MCRYLSVLPCACNLHGFFRDVLDSAALGMPRVLSEIASVAIVSCVGFSLTSFEYVKTLSFSLSRSYGSRCSISQRIRAGVRRTRMSRLCGCIADAGTAAARI